MNERIKELLQQAKKESSQWLGSKPATTMTYDELQKFTELIVRECAYIPIDMWDKAELNADVAVKIENRIKEHFGVEE